MIFPEDWLHVFELQTPVVELIARGSIFYFGILVLIRLMPRRTGGEMAAMDLIFIFLVAESAAHGLGTYSSVLDGLILIATLMFWNFFLNMLSFYIPFIEKLVSAPPLQVVRHGQLLRRNMRREFLTKEELMEQLRRQGIDDLSTVKAAYVEAKGDITVILE